MATPANEVNSNPAGGVGPAVEPGPATNPAGRAKPASAMTDDELVAEWLACERACGDPLDDDEVRRAEARQLEIEAEQDRRG